jgi:hypothetical protein
MILHLASKGMDVPVPIKNVNGTYQSLETISESKIFEKIIPNSVIFATLEIFQNLSIKV